ncbi:MAG: hypothetical protein ACLUW6_10670 [Coriobacteriaceae bacterium]
MRLGVCLGELVATPARRTGVVCGILLEATSFAFVFAAAAVLVAASLFVAVCLRAARKKKDAAHAVPFPEDEGHGEFLAPRPRRGNRSRMPPSLPPRSYNLSAHLRIS